MKEKHPKPAPIPKDAFLHGPIEDIPSWFFESINEESVMEAVLRSSRSSGPPGLDAEAYRRILCSKNFSASGKSLREEIAVLVKNLATKAYDPELIGCYTASRLIPLSKNPGIRPIGVGEVM